MTSVRILLADDELLARKRLIRRVENIPNTEPVAVCSSGEKVLEERFTSPGFLRVHRRHILKLDMVERPTSTESGGYIAHTRTNDTVPISHQVAGTMRKRMKF
ncbi:MAG: LytTR family transcriptional regulator DNA-binding domain-containing protein [Deltaproteobacteria bacterium]|nr:LytTR family transcriptional regulator DNA-binding domain-containing protein [Deltaproteobacteria bacterium]